MRLLSRTITFTLLVALLSPVARLSVCNAAAAPGVATNRRNSRADGIAISEVTVLLPPSPPSWDGDVRAEGTVARNVVDYKLEVCSFLSDMMRLHAQ